MIVWVNGGVPCGVNDLTLARSNIVKKLFPGEKIVTDKGYRDETFFIHPYLTNHDAEMTKKIRAMHENVNAKIIWSQILPRSSWIYSNNKTAMNAAVKRINSFAGKKVILNKGYYIRYPDLMEVSPSMYKADGIHLTLLGNCIFLCQISSALEAFRTGDVFCFE